MRITIRGTQLELTDAIKQYATEKVEGLTKFNDTLQLARVELEAHHQKNEGQRFRAEVTIDAPNEVYRAEEKNADLYAAIDLVIPKLVTQIEKAKSYADSKHRRIQRKLKDDEYL